MKLLNVYVIASVIAQSTETEDIKRPKDEKWTLKGPNDEPFFCSEEDAGFNKKSTKVCKDDEAYCCNKEVPLQDSSCSMWQHDLLAKKEIGGWRCVYPKTPRTDKEKKAMRNCLASNEYSPSGYKTEHGKLGQFTKGLAIVVRDWVDRPWYQCQALKKLRKTFKDLLKTRKMCKSKTQDKVKKMAAKNKRLKEKAENQAKRAKKQAEKEENQALKAAKDKKERKRREDEEDISTLIFNEEDEVINSSDVEAMEKLADDMDTDLSTMLVSDESLSETFMEECDNKDEMDAECLEIQALLAASLNQETKSNDEQERALVIQRIGKARQGIVKWANVFIDPICNKRQRQLLTRVRGMTSKLVKIRQEYNTNPTRNKLEELAKKKANQEKKAKQAEREQNKKDQAQKQKEKAQKKADKEKDDKEKEAKKAGKGKAE